MAENIPLSIPETHLSWNLYGAGYEMLGREGAPEEIKTLPPAPDQILARIDSVGICYSDVKLIQQGNTHAKIAGRDLFYQPTRPGHEVCFTVVSVGENLKDQFSIAERYSILPEIILNQNRQTYGFSIPGGLTQYQLIGPELLNTDQGMSILKLDPAIGYSEASLLEPWGSVLASYTPARRLIPKKKGKMWIIGNPSPIIPFTFSQHLNLPDFILVTDIPHLLESRTREIAKEVKIANGVDLDNYAELSRKITGGLGFDDIVVLDPSSARQIEELISLLSPGGLMNLVGTRPLDAGVMIDPRRIHYDYVAVVGNSTQDISASYGAVRNRSEILQNGMIVLFGGGGPMGQMHLLRALGMENGPRTILVCEINQKRIEHLKLKFGELAKKCGKDLIILNMNSDLASEFPEIFKQITAGQKPDDLIVLVPKSDVFEQASGLIQDDSLLNLFAGTPEGQNFTLDLSKVYLGNLQLTGASGLGNAHYLSAYEQARSGLVDLNTAVAAVGGMRAALNAIRASEEARYPGKIVIYPQLEHLPLLDIRGLAEKYPDIKSSLGSKNLWTQQAEAKLFELAGK